ncbi:MAG: hypothetical protein WC796_04500 [Candidatus Pacearchaeota archaeon]|jgi:hypothetical protein
MGKKDRLKCIPAEIPFKHNGQNLPRYLFEASPREVREDQKGSKLRVATRDLDLLRVGYDTREDAWRVYYPDEEGFELASSPFYSRRKVDCQELGYVEFERPEIELSQSQRLMELSGLTIVRFKVGDGLWLNPRNIALSTRSQGFMNEYLIRIIEEEIRRNVREKKERITPGQINDLAVLVLKSMRGEARLSN